MKMLSSFRHRLVIFWDYAGYSSTFRSEVMNRLNEVLSFLTLCSTMLSAAKLLETIDDAYHLEARAWTDTEGGYSKSSC